MWLVKEWMEKKLTLDSMSTAAGERKTERLVKNDRLVVDIIRDHISGPGTE